MEKFQVEQYIQFNYKAECIVVSDACKEAMWLYRFTGKLGMTPSNDGPTVLYSTETIAHIKESKFL